jgi:hypothetical protein
VSDEFNQAAQHAQESLGSLLAGAEEARARFAEVRTQVAAATQRFDTHWAAVAERAVHYLQTVSREEEQLTASREETRQALLGLRSGLGEVHEHGPQEVEHAQAGFDEAAERIRSREPEMVAALDVADQAEQALASRLEEVQTEVDAAIAQTEEMMAGASLEMEQIQQEIEHRVVQLNATITGECLPAVMSRAQALYEQLVQAEQEIRTTLESALEATESVADRALRDCRDGFGDALAEVGKLGQTLDEALFDVKLFLDGGRAKLQERGEGWDDTVRTTREGLREAIGLLKEVEDYLAKFAFGR